MRVPNSIKKIAFPILVFIIAFFYPIKTDGFSGSAYYVSKVFFGFGMAIIGMFFQFVFQAGYLMIVKNNLGFLKREKKYLSVILMLAAKIVQADGKVDQSEINLVKKRLSKEFKDEHLGKYFAEFESYLTREISLRELGVVIRNDFDESAKSHLMYLLISIATADGFLSNSELSTIQKVAKYGRISPKSYLYIFKTFEFKREQKKYQKSKQSTGQRKQPARASVLRKAYAIIGVKEGATIDEIKKAYRKLAKIHHPDKVAHLGEEHQMAAKEKFQLIVDAYDMVKEAAA